jgi:hypothetical protein
MATNLEVMLRGRLGVLSKELDGHKARLDPARTRVLDIEEAITAEMQHQLVHNGENVIDGHLSALLAMANEERGHVATITSLIARTKTQIQETKVSFLNLLMPVCSCY